MRVGVALDCNDEPAGVIGAASNQNDREKGPNDYVTNLRVLVSRHRSLSASAALAV